MAPEALTTDDLDERQEYIDDMARRRGYVLNYHQLMAEADFPVLQASNALVHAAYLKPRLLDQRTKELLFILSLTVMRAEQSHIQSHMKVALDIGVSAHEILETLEIALPEAGVVAFQWGLEAWRAVTDAQGLTPTVAVFDGTTHGD